MTLGDRIEQRRIAIGLSQAELARRVGVRQSTMNSLIKGNSQSSRSLVKIARELRTTPQFLTGEIDDPDADPLVGLDFNAEEREIVDCLRMIPAKDRAALIQLARSLASVANLAQAFVPEGVPIQTLQSPKPAYQAK